VGLRKMEFRSDAGLRDSLANRALGGDASRRNEHRAIAESTARAGVPFIDTYDAFDPDSRRMDYIVYPGDGHPNAAGHLLYAKAIADWLRANGYVPEGAWQADESGRAEAASTLRGAVQSSPLR
jgi:hypothetical protein